jgi:hypothetical protein
MLSKSCLWAARVRISLMRPCASYGGNRLVTRLVAPSQNCTSSQWKWAFLLKLLWRSHLYTSWIFNDKFTGFSKMSIEPLRFCLVVLRPQSSNLTYRFQVNGVFHWINNKKDIVPTGFIFHILAAKYIIWRLIPTVRGMFLGFLLCSGESCFVLPGCPLASKLSPKLDSHSF